MNNLCENVNQQMYEIIKCITCKAWVDSVFSSNFNIRIKNTIKTNRIEREHTKTNYIA